MQFQISIASDNDVEKKPTCTHHDLNSISGVESAYERVKNIHNTGSSYRIIEIESEWNYFSETPFLDEVIETVEFLNKMDKEQQEAFKAIAKKGEECPSEIANRVFHGTILTIEDVKFQHEDDIWTFFVLNKEKVAITY